MICPRVFIRGASMLTSPRAWLSANSTSYSSIGGTKAGRSCQPRRNMVLIHRGNIDIGNTYWSVGHAGPMGKEASRCVPRCSPCRQTFCPSVSPAFQNSYHLRSPHDTNCRLVPRPLAVSASSECVICQAKGSAAHISSHCPSCE